MFQYAAGRAAATRLDDKLFLDLSDYCQIENNKDTKRKFELSNFSVKARILTRYQSLKYGIGVKRPRISRLIKKFMGDNIEFNYYNEPSHWFDDNFTKVSGNLIIRGRFQSERYFKEIRKNLVSEFAISSDTSQECKNLIQELRGENMIAVHVRRGDYVSNHRYAKTLGVLPIEYYEKAFDIISRNVENKMIFSVFSDDINWCRKQKAFRIAERFIDLKALNNSTIEEFEIMRNCKYFIISNSTYAWWAAWLCEAPEKIVIAPSCWARDPSLRTDTRLPESWIAI